MDLVAEDGGQAGQLIGFWKADEDPILFAYVEKLPEGLVGDHGRTPERRTICIGAPGGPENKQGAKSTGTRVGAARS